MRTLLALVLTGLCLTAAEGGASISPAPGFEPPRAGASSQQRPMQQPMMMPRPAMAFEVEVLTVKAGDAVALAQWAELAALGFHVVAAVPGDGQVSVYLERAMMGGAPGGPRLPAAIDSDMAAKLRTRIEAALAERQRVNVPRPPQTTVEEKK
jgi:hypothetical protein